MRSLTQGNDVITLGYRKRVDARCDPTRYGKSGVMRCPNGCVTSCRLRSQTDKRVGGMMHSLAELEGLPTLRQGQTDDLKVDKGSERIWLSRMTVEDGMEYDGQVTIERLVNGCWVEVETYQAL